MESLTLFDRSLSSFAVVNILTLEIYSSFFARSEVSFRTRDLSVRIVFDNSSVFNFPDVIDSSLTICCPTCAVTLLIESCAMSDRVYKESNELLSLSSNSAFSWITPFAALALNHINPASTASPTAIERRIPRVLASFFCCAILLSCCRRSLSSEAWRITSSSHLSRNFSISGDKPSCALNSSKAANCF